MENAKDIEDRKAYEESRNCEEIACPKCDCHFHVYWDDGDLSD